MPNSYDNSKANRTGVPGLHVGTGNRFQIPDATSENAQALHSTIASRLSAAARKTLNPQVAQDVHGNFVVRVNNPGFNNTEEARTFDITRGSNGLILGGATDNPAYRAAVTGIANFGNNTVRNNITTLVEVLHKATSGDQQSIGKVMQDMSMPSMEINALTPQMGAKWSTAYLAVNPNNKTGNANRTDIVGSHIPGFQVQWGGKFGQSGAAHIWDAQALHSQILPQNQYGESALEKAKRYKNEVVPFGHLQTTPGIPASIRQMSMHLPGQTQSDNVYARRVGFQMFGGDELSEGAQLVNQNMGYLATDTFHKMRLNREQTNQFKAGNFDFQTGDIFRHRDTRINSIAAGSNIRSGLFDSIPGLNVSGGSSQFSMIRNMQFDESTGTLGVTVSQYTNAAVGASKFQKKAQMVPVSGYNNRGAFNVRDNQGQLFGFQGVQAMPSPSGAATIGLNALRTTYSEDQLKPMFVDYAMSTFRMGQGQQLIKSGEEGYDSAFPLSQEVASHMYGAGALKGYASSIMSSMGAAHFNASMKLGFTDQTVSQEQYDTYNKSFDFGGQSYQRFSNPTPAGNGFLNVQAANVYSDLTIGERYQKSYDTGRTTFSGAILNNMAYSHPENYSTLSQRQAREGNSAMRFRQVMMANTDANALAQLQRQRKIVDVGQLGAGDILAGIPQDHPDRQGEFMRQLAAGKFGGAVVRMGNNLLPSPREALSRITEDKDNRIVKNFGSSYFDAISTQLGIADTAAAGMDTSSAQAAYEAASNHAYSQAQKLANESSTIEKSQAITQRNTAGGPAMSAAGLQPNQILMSRDTYYNMMGVNDLPENMREQAQSMLDFHRESNPDYSVIEHTMHPITLPHNALFNLNPMFREEYEKQFGEGSAPDVSGGQVYISPVLATASSKDMDSDTNKARAVGGVFRKGRSIGSYRHSAKPTSNEYIQHLAAMAYEEQKTLRESLDYTPASYRAESSAYARNGLYKSTDTILTGPKGFSGQQESQASIGPTYNTGIGKMVGFARLMGNRSKAEAAGWISQVGYQTATKEKAFNDPGFTRISQMLKSGNYDWGKQGDHVAGYVGTNGAGEQEYVNFKQNVRSHEQNVRGQNGGLGSRSIGGSVIGNLSAHIAEGFAMLDSSTESNEEYINKVAPNVARMMLPDRMDSNSEAHNIMTQALITSRQSGDFSGAMSTFSGLVGGRTGVIDSVFGQGDRVSSSMAMVGAAMQSRMFDKNEPAAMSRHGTDDRSRARLYDEALAGMDIKDTSSGGTAHNQAVDRLNNHEVNAHTIAVDEQIRGDRSGRVAQGIPSTPAQAGALRRQSRAEYFAGKGGLYTKNQKASVQGFFGEGLGIDDLNANQLFGYDAMNVMERTVLGMKHMNPDLKDMPVSMGSGKRFEPSYNPNNHEIRLPNPDEFQGLVADKMGDDKFMNRMAGIIGVDKDQLTPELVMAGIIGHEFGHARDNANLSASGGLKAAREQDRMERHRAMNGLMRYEDVTSEVTADSIANQQLNSLGESGADLGLYRDSKRVRQSGMVIQEGSAFTNLSDRAAMGMSDKSRKVTGVKKPYQQSKSQQETAKIKISGDVQYYNSDGSMTPAGEALEASFGGSDDEPPSGKAASGGLQGGGDYTSNTTFQIAHQTVNNSTYRTKLTDNRDVEELSSFVRQGKLGKLNSYMEQVGSAGIESLSRSQLRDFRETMAHYNKAANAVDTYSKEAQGVASDETGKQRLSQGALGVEKELASQEGRVGEAFGAINRHELREISAQAKSQWEGGLPDKYAVSGKDVSKGMAGVSNIQDLGASLGELAKSVKNVTSVTQEQYKSMQTLTKSYDAAEHVISKLANKQQQGMELSSDEQDALAKSQGTVEKHKGDLDTIRETYAKAAMGGIGVQGPVMGNEERQQRLMEVLNRGGTGGARARSKAKRDGLYSGTDEEGNESGLDYLGFNFKSEDSINAIGGLMRLGNRASSVLHGMTHLTHNIINPIAAEIEQYGNTQVSRSQMMYGITGGMTGQANQILARQGSLNIARETASQQVYNTYAGLSGALGGQQSGMLQGIAQSSLAPALSAAVGLQAIGGAALAGPAALGIAALGAGAWLSGAAGDSRQISSSVQQINQQNQFGSRTNWLNAPNNAIAAASLVFNPVGAKDAEGMVRAADVFGEWGTGRHTESAIPATYSIGLGGWYEKSAGKAGVDVASQFNGMSLSQIITGAGKTLRGMGVNVSDSDAGASMYDKYTKGMGLGLSESQQQGAFGFVAQFGGGQSANMLNDISTAYKAGRTGITESISASVSATGGSIYNPNAVDAGYINNEAGYAEWKAKGRAPGAYDQFVRENSAWATQSNTLNRAAYGSATPAPGGLIQASDDRYIDDPRLRDANIQARQSAVNAAQTNVGAFRGGYGAASDAKRMSFGLDTVGLGVFNQNEQIGLSQSLQMQTRMGGSGLSVSTINQTANLNQVQGGTLSNILGGDAWTTSRLAKQLGNVGLATLDTKTGLGATDYGVSSDQLAAFKKADKLGMLNGVSAADIAGGTMGIQRSQELAQRDMQMYQFTQGQQQRAVQYNTMVGGGTLGNNGMVQGGSLAGNSAIYAQYGMKFNAGNGMTQWQVQDAQTQMGRQQQVFGMNQQGQQLAISMAQFGTGQNQYNENRALQVAQFNYNTAFTGHQMQIDRSHQVEQQSWQKADLQYSRNMSQLQFGFQMRDADRNIRYARGRDRLDLMRQRDDSVILHAAEMGQQDKQEDRQTKQEKWSEEQFKRDEDHFKKSTDFQKQQMDLDKKYHDLDVGYQKQSLQMQAQAHSMSMQWMNQEFKLEDQGRLLDRQGQLLQINMANEAAVKQQQLQVMMNRTNDILSGIGNSQHNIMSQWQADLQTTKGYAAALHAALVGGGNATGNGSAYGYTGSSGTGSGNVYGGGLSIGGYMMTRAEASMRSFDAGGFTGYGDKTAPRGTVHGGEYVIPQQGTAVIRGDNQESLAVMKAMLSVLERMEKNPAVVNAVISTNQSKFAMKNLNLTDLAHGSIQ